MIFLDGICPKCGKQCGNGGDGVQLHCSCGWTGGLDPRDVKVLEEIIQRNQEKNRRRADET